MELIKYLLISLFALAVRVFIEVVDGLQFFFQNFYRIQNINGNLIVGKNPKILFEIKKYRDRHRTSKNNALFKLRFIDNCTLASLVQ